MMYIEHTALQGNLHHKLNSRVLPYGTQSNSTTVAEAASELLARIRQAQIANEQRTLNIEQLPPKDLKTTNLNTNCKTSQEFVHLSNGDHTLPGHNIEEYNNVNHISKESVNQKSSHLVCELVEAESEEEEEYELIQVIDSESLEAPSVSRTTPATPTVEPPLPSKSKTNRKPTLLRPKLLSTEDDCSHFTIEIKEDSDNIAISDRKYQQQQYKPSAKLPVNLVQQEPNSIGVLGTQEEADDEEFEYIVTRVPKRRRFLQPPAPLAPLAPLPPPTQLTSKRIGQQNFLNTAESNFESLFLNNIPLASEPTTTKKSQRQTFSTREPVENNLRPSLRQEVSRKRKRSIPSDYPHYTYSDDELEYAAASQHSANQHRNNNYSNIETNTVAPVVEEETLYQPVDYNYPRQGHYSHRRYQEDQMGFDILNKIRNLLSFNKNSNQQTDTTTNVNQDNQRKRSYRSPEIDIEDPRQPKYRIIDNSPPKLFHAVADDDDIQFVTSSSYGQQQQLLQQQEQEQQERYKQQILFNRNFGNSGVNYKNNRNFMEMSNGHSRLSNDKMIGRKSIFSAPQITQHIVRNPSYADLEFSDEEDDNQLHTAMMKRSGNIECNNAMRSSIPKIFNIPITNYRRTATTQPIGDGRFMMDNTRSLSQPMLAPSSSSIFQSKSQMQTPIISSRSGCNDDLSYMSKLKLGANQTKYHLDDYRNQQKSHHVRSSGSTLNTSSHMTGKFSGRLLNGLATGQFGSSMWPPASGRSILLHEKETEEREKYRQLLEQMAPQEYGSRATAAATAISMYDRGGGNNKKLSATDSDIRRRRSALMVAAATSSSNSSPIINDAKNMGSRTKFQRLPLSSTINLDDDDDNGDNGGGGDSIMSSRTTALLKNKQQQQRIKNKWPPTLIIDDDDISDIVDLGIQQEHYRPSKLPKSVAQIVDLTKNDKKEESKLPYVEPINTLQERFNCSPHLKSNWYDEWRTKWQLRKQATSIEVEETAKLAAKFTTERRLIEAELQESLYNIQITDDDDLAIIAELAEPKREPDFIELTNEQKQRVQTALRAPVNQVLVSKFNLNITSRDIHTLLGNNWLNDEVINFYMNLLTDRGEQKHESHGLPTVYAMNTFFIPRLMQAGYAGVKRWTRKVDIFSKDIIPVPVHVGGVHWCMAVIHLKNRTIKYYDSMGTPNPSVLRTLEQYLKEESLDKRKEPLDTTGFQIESVQNVPRQLNGSDCGVFSCMFAEYITRDRDITFTQENMEYFRQKMILEILQGELLQ